MPVYGWLLDAKKCIECRACEAACKQWNKVETGLSVRYRMVHTYESGSYPNVSTMALSLACNHCDNPLCLRVCPTRAISRDGTTGAVLIDGSRCVGCQQCRAFCPYLAPQFNERTGKMEKCTLCNDRLGMGLEPACSSLCPTGALRFARWEEIEATGADQVAHFPTPRTTLPAIRFVTGTFPKR